ncbi:MAG TPA: phage holin family protein [Rhizomicrobium sp.]|jgi:hypothetical protein
MSTSRLIQHAHLVWRSERVIAELRLKRLLGSLGLQAFAALMTGFALALFELAAYFALIQTWSAIGSAAILGICNLGLAGVLMLFAARRPASRELALANEVHRDALNAFTAEVHESETTAPASLRTALESAIIPVLLPLIPLVIQRLRKHRREPAEQN